ncbi:MAG: hypothetical protein KAR16_08920 [Bacteroidales bacterium]|nr:hypothetical protein [Bacteroidales bacterium]
MRKQLFSLLFLILYMFPACTPKPESLLIGAKIYEHSGPYDQLFERWNELGINTGFCSLDLISDQEFMSEASDHNISTFVIFPVFFNPDTLAHSPDLAAINRDGEAAAEEWVEFVCPSREGYRHQVVEKARRIVRNHRPDGISIDFIRHFVYWEKVYPGRDPASLPISCFDSVCIDHFQTETGTAVPSSLIGVKEKADWILESHSDEWTRWRCGLITSMVEEITEASREEKPDILVNIHLVPWGEEDFDGGIKRVAGQDINALSEHVDMLSPMTYAHMVKQEPPWIHDITDEIYLKTGSPVIPSIQVGKAYLNTEFDLDEFSETVEQALKPPSGGVVIWSWERLIAEPEKVTLLKEILEDH